ncbi:MAG TPA: TIGR02186 family protein [Arsenicitalea sp.]|nr:TIGR02186 family protein [Arsenicitalea sp.]
MIRAAALAALLAVSWSGGSVRAEQLVTTLSNPNIAITSNFAGETLSVFGNVEPDPGASRDQIAGPYNVVLVIIGPSVNRVARLKTNKFGLWMNTEQVEFDTFPTFFHVLANDRLERITTHDVLEAERILPDAQTRIAARPNSLRVERFGAELVRLMTEKKLFGINEFGVKFLSTTAYTAQLPLPADIPNGLFIAQTYLFKDGVLLAKRGDSFAVNKTGFERFISSSARDYPLLYGLTCVALALLTGWLAGVIFKR